MIIKLGFKTEQGVGIMSFVSVLLLCVFVFIIVYIITRPGYQKTYIVDRQDKQDDVQIAAKEAKRIIIGHYPEYSYLNIEKILLTRARKIHGSQTTPYCIEIEKDSLESIISMANRIGVKPTQEKLIDDTQRYHVETVLEKAIKKSNAAQEQREFRRRCAKINKVCDGCGTVFQGKPIFAKYQEQKGMLFCKETCSGRKTGVARYCHHDLYGGNEGYLGYCTQNCLNANS